jgi:hypothetical protein
MLLGSLWGSAGLSLTSACTTGAAHASPAEAVRRSAANIPGYGPSDVFFPGSWAGTWRVQRQVSLPNNSNNDAGAVDVPLVLDYRVRFLLSNDGAVVADRGFNQASLEAAARQESRLPTYEWVASNPNDVTVAWPDGRRKDIKVTQRATDASSAVATTSLWSSEVQRVTTMDRKDSVPYITARRVVTQYQYEEATTTLTTASTTPLVVQALEVVYDLGESDPLRRQTGGGASTPSLLSKSRILMQHVVTP